MEFKGVVETVTFRNNETGYTVLKVHIMEGGHELPKSIAKRIPVICNTPNAIVKNEDLSIVGDLVNHPTYGPQINATQVTKIMPKTKVGVLALLESGFVKGIGKKRAKIVVDYFGQDALTVIEKDWEKLTVIKGITIKKAKEIHDNYMEKHIDEANVGFCCSLGISLLMANKIVKELGNNTKKIITKDPYILMFVVDGIGFKKADAIAMKCGIKKTDEKRLRAGLTFVLENASSSGNCGLPREQVVVEMQNLLNDEENLVSENLVKNALAKELLDREGNLVSDTIEDVECIFTKKLYYSERNVGKKLLELLNSKQSKVGYVDNVEALIKKVGNANVELSAQQIEAVKLAMENDVCVITGGPGVGKTTIVDTILKILKHLHKYVFLAAPTGRASKRMSETTNHTAKTIHRLLEYSEGKFKKDENNPLECDAIIIDETSMVDAMLMNCLLKAIDKGTKVIFVGDVDQLPSVGAGKVLEDMIESGKIPVARLTEIFRQAQGSKIITNAHRINDSVMPNLENDIENDFFFVEALNPQDASNKIRAMINNNIPKRWGYDPVQDVQVLCPMKASAVGTENLNTFLQYDLNPNIKVAERQKEILNKHSYKLTIEEHDFMAKYPDKIPVIERFGRKYTIGDKVMQVKNNYDKNVFNGDVGTISDIDTINQIVYIHFDLHGEAIEYAYEELNEIMLAYAITIHKSQGSEYPVVVMPVMSCNFIMLKKKLLYTGVTRGKKIVILVGDKKSIAIAIHNKTAEKRYTKLKEWLKIA